MIAISDWYTGPVENISDGIVTVRRQFTENGELIDQTQSCKTIHVLAIQDPARVWLAYSKTIPTAPYATPGTLDVPASIEAVIRDHSAVLLERHGALTCGRDLDEAYGRLEVIEHAARITHLARQLGPVPVLPPAEVARIRQAATSAGLLRTAPDYKHYKIYTPH